MTQYINVMLHPEPKPLNEMLAMVDVSSSTNQQFLDNLQKYKVVAKMNEEWLQLILKETEQQIRLLDKASKETIVMTKKVESNNKGFEKERNNWVKVVLWTEEIQRFGSQNFQVECPITGLDDETLHLIKDCIEWRNEVLVHVVTKIKEILDGLKLVDEIIQCDLKWFSKHCARKQGDFVALWKN